MMIGRLIGILKKRAGVLHNKGSFPGKRSLFLLIICLLLMAGCGGKTDNEKEDDPAAAAESNTAEETAGETEKETDKEADKEADKETPPLFTVEELNRLLEPRWRTGAVAQEVYSFVWITDTQGYASQLPELGIFPAMTDWVIACKNDENISYVFHTGDLTDNPEREEEWQVSADALYRLNGVVPYSVLAGNHDCFAHHDINAEVNYETYNRVFGRDSIPGDGELFIYGNGEASVRLIHIGSFDYLMIAVGFGLDENVCDFVNRLLAMYPEAVGVLTTHDYMLDDGSLSENGQLLFREIVEPNTNVHLVLCGHNHNSLAVPAALDDNGDGKTDRTVYQLLFDPQMAENCGNGFLKLLYVDERNGEIRVETYSPYADSHNLYDPNEYPEKDSFSFPIRDWFR